MGKRVTSSRPGPLGTWAAREPVAEWSRGALDAFAFHERSVVGTQQRHKRGECEGKEQVLAGCSHVIARRRGERAGRLPWLPAHLKTL